MKKAFTFFFLPVFLFGIIGWQWMFFLRLAVHEGKEWRDDGDLRNLEIVRLVNSIPGRTFFVNDHELVHDGKLYDVKHKEMRNGILLCYCKHDSAEENLLSAFVNRTADVSGNSFFPESAAQFIVKLSLFETTDPGFTFNQHDVNGRLTGFPPDTFKTADSPDAFFVPPEVA